MSKFRLQLQGAGVALAVFIADQASKLYLLQHVVPEWYSRIVVTPFFNLVHAWNHGTAFSLFAHESNTQRLILIAVTSLITAVVIYWLTKADRRLPALCYGAIIGGAVGNITDRLHHGAVFDFLQFHLEGYAWPSFNLADSAIVLGVVILLWDTLRHPEVPNKTEEGQKPSS